MAKSYLFDNVTKRQIGVALWQIRHEKHLYLKNVTTATNIPSLIIEGMELGKFIQYSALQKLGKYYDKKIKITFE